MLRTALTRSLSRYADLDDHGFAFMAVLSSSASPSGTTRRFVSADDCVIPETTKGLDIAWRVGANQSRRFSSDYFLRLMIDHRAGEFLRFLVHASYDFLDPCWRHGSHGLPAVGGVNRDLTLFERRTKSRFPMTASVSTCSAARLRSSSVQVKGGLGHIRALPKKPREPIPPAPAEQSTGRPRGQQARNEHELTDNAPESGRIPRGRRTAKTSQRK